MVWITSSLAQIVSSLAFSFGTTPQRQTVNRAPKWLPWTLGRIIID